MKLETGSDSHGSIIEFGDSTDDNYGEIVSFASGAGEGGRMKFTAGAIETMNLRGGKVGIGTASPDAAVLHVFQGSAGTVTPHSTGDDLVIEANTDGGLTIVTPDANSGRILWTSPSTSGDIGARIAYQQSTDLMSIGTAGGQIFCQGSNVGIGTESPTAHGAGVCLDVGGGLHADPTVLIDSATGGNPRLYFDTGAANRGCNISFLDQGTKAGGISYEHNGDYLKFITASSTAERMRLDSSGQLGLNTTAPAGLLDCNGTSYFRNTMHTTSKIQWVGAYYPTFVASGNDLLLRRDDTLATMVKFTTGGATVASDERLKENIATITRATDKVKQLRGVTHTWKEYPDGTTNAHSLQDPDNPSQVHLGLIAQEVEPIIPEVVHTANITEEQPVAYKHINYEKLVPLLIESIKELSAEVEQLKQQAHDKCDN